MFVFSSVSCFSQAAIITRDPYWVASEEKNASLDLADRAKQYAEYSQKVNDAKDRLKYIKEATKKLKEINRKVADYRRLEECLVYTYRAYDRFDEYSKTLSQSDCFKPEELKYILSLFDNCLSMTSTSINALSVVVTDNLSEMSDGQRLMNINIAIKELRSNVGVFYGLIDEVDILKNQRNSLRTYQVFVGTLK